MRIRAPSEPAWTRTSALWETRSAHRGQPELLQQQVGDLMAWNQRPGPSGSGPSDGWMRQFLRRDAERQVGMLTALTERLERDLAKLPDGQLPGKEWVRVARLRLDAYRMLATLELETARVRLLAQRANQRAPLSDEEYQAQIQALGRDAVRALSVEKLEAEMERRRALRAPAEPR